MTDSEMSCIQVWESQKSHEDRRVGPHQEPKSVMYALRMVKCTVVVLSMKNIKIFEINRFSQFIFMLIFFAQSQHVNFSMERVFSMQDFKIVQVI